MLAEQDAYQCEGQFRLNHECDKAVDGDTMTSAVPDAYNDSAAVIEEYPIPPTVTTAVWQGRVLRNNFDITIKAFYWDYNSNVWVLFYDVPYSLDYTTYRVSLPVAAILTSPLRTKVQVKNAGAMSGEYFEGLVDWILTGTNYFSCERDFRTDFECWKAVDGDTMTQACPAEYDDSAFVIEEHSLPAGVGSAIWQFRALNNNPCIEVEARYWDYPLGQWMTFYVVHQSDQYITYRVPVPSGGLVESPMRIKMYLRNGGWPCYLQSAEYFEASVDWIECSSDRDGDEICDSRDNCPLTFNPNQLDANEDGIGDECDVFRCGDCNGDGAVNVGDAVCMINYVFKGGSTPDCFTK